MVAAVADMAPPVVVKQRTDDGVRVRVSNKSKQIFLSLGDSEALAPLQQHHACQQLQSTDPIALWSSGRLG